MSQTVHTKPSAKQPSPLLLDGNNLRIEDIEPVAKQKVLVELSPQAQLQLSASRQVVDKLINDGAVIYGINTGFGKFKDTLIKPADILTLQKNLVVSHAAGVGPAFDAPLVRTVMLLRANSLAKGFSGIRTKVVQLLLDCLNQGIHPIVPEQGSVGASGDLAPLAHLALVLIGEGLAQYQGEILPGLAALSQAGLSPVSLESKEGLALLNGTQVMAALGVLILTEAERLAKITDIIGAMSLEAQLGSAKAFASEIHNVRPHPGQLASAQNMRTLLSQSTLVDSHKDCGMVQDAYSLRCIPQVHGASRQTFKHLREVLEIEINSATDNPLVFNDSILSGGNFHGQPLALALDYVAIGLAELANISERRTERLVNPALSNGLPAFLTKHGGLNSGYMVAQYTAAALVSENKVLAHPASTDSIPTSANIEDHVSMGTTSGRKARMILNNLHKVLSIELVCAAQGLDYRTSTTHSPSGHGHDHQHRIEPGPGIKAAHALVRSQIKHLDYDREIHQDFAIAEDLIKSGALLAAVEAACGSLA